MLQSRVGGWIKNWLWKGKNEAHLPADDKPSVSFFLTGFIFLSVLSIWLSTTQVCVNALMPTSGSGTDNVHVCQIVWDEKKQKWVDLNEPEEEVRKTICKTRSASPKKQNFGNQCLLL